MALAPDEKLHFWPVKTMSDDTVRSVPGTEDMLPRQRGWWRKLQRSARRLFETYGYGHLRTPVIEYSTLFEKGTGETTDIVEKQMYTLSGDEDITLRPEGTPPAIRTYLENSLHKTGRFQKFYYMGPMFRRERPQKGRLRQFHQAGVEAIGSDSPLTDAETIILAADIYRDAGLEDFTVLINSIGCDCRDDYRAEVYELLQDDRDRLCEDCRKRMERNVFRVLDCKKKGCQKVVEDLPVITDYLCDACSEHYAMVKGALDDADVDYEEEPRLVRGLDYYTRTVFEIKHPGLGARDTICGGGRYDDLVELLGGPSIPCVGFAMGMEASVLALEAEHGEPESVEPRPLVYAVSFEKPARAENFRLIQELRSEGIIAEMDFEQRSAKAQMRMADSCGAPLAVLTGGREMEEGVAMLKEMQDGEQWDVPREDAVGEIREFLRRNGHLAASGG